MKIIFQKIIPQILLITVLAFPFQGYAYEVSEANVDIRGDFVLEQAKHQLFMKPGESKTVYISVVNRTDKRLKFKVEVEDFKGSRDIDQTVVLLGQDKGPYTLKDYLKPEVDEFILDSKQRIRFKVDVTIPYDAQPGGRYGSLLVLNQGPVDKDGNLEAGNRAAVLTRLGSLFFVRVEGDVVEKGRMEDFRLSKGKKFYTQGPVEFEILYSNDGNVHLTPYGNITIKNMLGREVGMIEVDPFFVLPDSLRARVVKWDRGFLFGRYTATANIKRGYLSNKEVVDTASVTFWVIPWIWIAVVLVVVLLLVFIVGFFRSKFEIKRKRS